MTPLERRAAYLLKLSTPIALAKADKAISQAKLARHADTDPGTVSKFLAGADIRVSTFCAIAEAAGYEVQLVPKLRNTA